MCPDRRVPPVTERSRFTMSPACSSPRFERRKVSFITSKDIDSPSIARTVRSAPFTAIESVSRAIVDTQIRLGAQNMSENNFGAHTGEICAGMLKEFLVRYVILGHSERRHGLGESDALVNAKVGAAWASGLVPILCLGETAAERDSGRTLDAGITRAVWMDIGEMQANASRLRSPLVLLCVQDYLAGRRHPLTLVTHVD